LKKDEIVTANMPVVSIISDKKFEIKTLISEIDIAKIKIGNEANVTLDAYGPDKIFKARVIHIDPAATIIENVPSYQVKLEFINPTEEIKDGMTANLDIITNHKENVLFIPRRAVFSEDSKKFVRVLTPQKTIEEREVKTGIVGEEAKIEITEGLSEGEIVVVSGK
jgi:RND family efflux transporter MFP subunit